VCLCVCVCVWILLILLIFFTNFASTSTVYYSANNGRILMFEVSKRPYRSSRNDGIIFRWLHNPPGGEKWNLASLVKSCFFFSSIHASPKSLYSLCFSTYMKTVNITWFYGPGATTFAHKVLISTTFVTQSFDFKMTYFRRRHSRRKSLLFKCKLLNKL